MKHFLLVICIAAAITNISAYFCSDKNCGNAQHIGCGHNGQFSDNCPADAAIVHLTDYMKYVLLDGHNSKRNFIAGGGDANHSPACRMATMHWDAQLEYLADLNVKQCEIKHDACHNTDDFKYSGQNLAYTAKYGDYGADIVEILKNSVEMWYAEVKNSQQSYIDSYPTNYSGPKIGHFTAMMIDRNIRVGCAASTYSEAGTNYKIYLVACNYAIANILTLPTYASCNQAATSCTTGTHPLYSNLCSDSEQYDVNNLF